MAQPAKKVAMSDDPVDRLSALPDGVLQHVLGFLPAQEAVRTSVLAPRWRDLWKSVRRLNITCSIEEHRSNLWLCNFVNSLFLLRDHAVLDKVDFKYDSALHENTNVWVRKALSFQTRFLSLSIPGDPLIRLVDPPLVSRYLRTLRLDHVSLEHKFLDFASCPTLELLGLTNCHIQTDSILSPSIKCLNICWSHFISFHGRTRIYVPSLTWLQLYKFKGTAPLLESMPSLETARVKPGRSVRDTCENGNSGECCGICASCSGDDDHKGRCVLIGALSSAVHLKLSACSKMYLFRRDLKWCPTFSKLKILELNDWCVSLDLIPLDCLLKHSPILEYLSLKLCNKWPAEFVTQTEGSNNMMNKPAALPRRLKRITITYKEIDDKIYKLLKLLSPLSEEIIIKDTKHN